jgi:hypothetical protein
MIIKVELYRAQTGLTQCYNCQNFGYIWANCKQLIRCLWCGGGHLNKESPEKTHTESTPSCCSYMPVEREKPCPASYRVCSHAKGELQREEHKEFPRNPLGGRSSLSSPHQGSPTQLHCFKTRNIRNHRHRRHIGKACGHPCSSICHNRKFGEEASQYRLTFWLTDTLKIATTVQQIVTELSEAVSEKDKIMIITKMALNLMKQNGY